MLKHQSENKYEKIVQYGKRVWGLAGDDDNIIGAAIEKTVEFFVRMKMPVSLNDVDLQPKDVSQIAKAHEKRGSQLGERQAIGPSEISEILALAA